MTVSYSGNLFQLLVRWKGSIWRCIWLDLTVFLSVFYALRVLYDVCLNPSQRCSVVPLNIFLNCRVDSQRNIRASESSVRRLHEAYTAHVSARLLCGVDREAVVVTV